MDAMAGESGPSAEASSLSAPSEARNPQPTLWKRYFDDEGVVQVPERSLNVHYYRRGSEGAAILCLHGGGYSGLTWSLVARKLSEDNR